MTGEQMLNGVSGFCQVPYPGLPGQCVGKAAYARFRAIILYTLLPTRKFPRDKVLKRSEIRADKRDHDPDQGTKDFSFCSIARWKESQRS